MTIRAEGSLLDWLGQRPSGALSLQEVAHLIRQAADALQYAHNYQIIYQKVAPSNFLIRSNGERPNLQLVDVRRATSPDGLPNVAGSMAPEQWRGAPVPATDQYALAILAYQLLTWQSPFQGNQEQVMYQHLNVQPQPPSRLNPRIPPAVDAVILRALAKKPEDRFPSISAFADAFQQAIQAPNPVPAAHMPRTPNTAIVRETITPGPPSPIPGLVPTTDIPRMPSISDPGNVAPSANNAVFTPQNLGQIPPTSSPDITGINRVSHSSQIRELLLLGLVFIIVVSGIGFGFYSIAKGNQTAAAHLQPTATAVKSRATLTPVATRGSYPNVARAYKGNTYNTTVNLRADISLIIEQVGGNINGYCIIFPPLVGSGPFTGTVDAARNIQLTLRSDQSGISIFFEGVVQSDGSLKGTYIVSDGEAGNWSAAPA